MNINNAQLITLKNSSGKVYNNSSSLVIIWNRLQPKSKDR